MTPQFIITNTRIHEQTETIYIDGHTNIINEDGSIAFEGVNPITYTAAPDTDITDYPQAVQDRITAARNAIASL